MTVSVFELFKIGIGPSSSHTVGPMVAARRFILDCGPAEALARIARVEVELYGSLALTGHGHGTDGAILLGLSGERPDTLAPEAAVAICETIRKTKSINLLGGISIAFSEDSDLHFRRLERLPHHSNGMRFKAFAADGAVLRTEDYYSVGGGFVVTQMEIASPQAVDPVAQPPVPMPFGSAAKLLELGAAHDLTIAEIVLNNELVKRDSSTIFSQLAHLLEAMEACIERGCRGEGLLPGRLKVPKRAGRLFEKLSAGADTGAVDQMAAMDWVNLWAIAVNEENASGGRVVTAPTNGAAGIIPAVLRYYRRFCPAPSEQGLRDFLLTAAAIGALYKQNASLSGAEVGCQGEVGVACSMAAAGLTAALGGSNAQIENAAEIGMEHNLGLTCDPIGGLVQIPCIERNAIGAVKAINASRMALLGDGVHQVSLDQVIATMRQTGADMKEQYKETSTGGLAVNVVEC